jgi:flagellar hook-associated protein 2
MPAVSFGGLSTGLNTDSIISSLMAIERLPRQRLALTQTAATTRQQALQDVLTRVKSLRTAASDLGSALLWSPNQTASSSDESRLTVRLNGGAAPGGYSIGVSQMATAAQATFAYAKPTADTTVDINGVTIPLAADTSLDDLAKTINGMPETGVFAVGLQDGRLVLSARSTGAAQTITASSDTLTADSTKAGRDLEWTLDGVAQPPSATNTIANAVPGASVTVKAPTAATTISISSPAVEADQVKAKLKAFVSAYNDVLDFTNGKLSEKKVVKGTDDQTQLTSADAAKGALFGDQNLVAMLSRLRQTVSTDAGLAKLGITTPTASGGATTDAAKRGKLSFDEKTFDAAYQANPEAVKQALNNTTGVAFKWERLLKPIAETDGSLAQRISSAESEVKRIKDAITRVDDRLVTREAQLQKMFTAMELAHSRNASSMIDLSSALARNSNNNR